MNIIFYLKAALIGVVEGVTEFLPVSSTGHLIIVEKLIKMSENTDFVDSFEVIIQLGAILAVVVYFFNKIHPFVKDKNEQKERISMWGKIIVAFLPAVFIGIIYSKLGLKKLLFNQSVVAFTLIFYGIVIILLEKYNAKREKFKINSINQITYKSAIIVGIFQCLAMVPGTSRSAATIIGAMLLGFSRAIAAEFSFLLAIPTMFAASAKDIMDSGIKFNKVEWTGLGVGFIVSFFVALIVIKYFMKFVQNKSFIPFGYYRIVVGIIVVVLITTGFYS